MSATEQRRAEARELRDLRAYRDGVLVQLSRIADGLAVLAVTQHDTLALLREQASAPPTAVAAPTPEVSVVDRVSARDMLDVGEVAELLSVSPSTVRYWRHAGGGPPGVKLGRSVRFRRSDVEAWVRAQTTGGAAAQVVETRPARRGSRMPTEAVSTWSVPDRCPGSRTYPTREQPFEGRGVCDVCGDSVILLKRGDLRIHNRRRFGLDYRTTQPVR